ncbi:MAG: glyoxalase, partial [Catenulispora sp.]
MAVISSLEIADPAEAWADLGFVVDDGRSRSQVGTVVHQLGAAGKGVVGWTLDGVSSDDLDGLPTALSPAVKTAAPNHPNGTLSIDHVVAITPDLDRTIKAF